MIEKLSPQNRVAKPKIRRVILLIFLTLSVSALFIGPRIPRWQRAASEIIAEAIFPYYVWRAEHDGFSFDVIRQKEDGTFPCGNSFTITAHGDGTIEYEGKGYSNVKALAKGSLSETQLKEISGLILAADYFSIPDQTPKSEVCATDTSVVTTSVTVAAKEHTVVNKCFVSDDLRRFEKKFREIVRVEQLLGSTEDCMARMQ